MELIRKALLSAMRAWFMTTFIGSVATAGLLCRLTHLLAFLSPKRRQQISAQIAGLAFRMIFTLNPQISIEHATDDEPAWDELFSSGTQAPIVLINHTSPLDSIFYSACMPTAYIKHVKTLAKSSLFKIPGFGTILHACGHFPVFFAKETATNNFSVDKQAQEKVAKDIETHLLEGGGLSMFPEGQLNPSDCKKLQTFRRGALQLAREKNLAVWGFLHTGIDTIWPVKDKFGGNPGRIRFKLFKLDIPSSVHSTDDLNTFVTHVENMMQLELNLMHALDEFDIRGIVESKRLLAQEVKLTADGDTALEEKLAEAVRMD